MQVDAQEIGDKGDPTELIAARMAAAEHGCLAIKVRGLGHLDSFKNIMDSPNLPDFDKTITR